MTFIGLGTVVNVVAILIGALLISRRRRPGRS